MVVLPHPTPGLYRDWSGGGDFGWRWMVFHLHPTSFLPLSNIRGPAVFICLTHNPKSSIVFSVESMFSASATLACARRDSQASRST